MHPLLTSINRYGLYLFAWLPIGGILDYVLAVPGKLGWLDATAIAVPLCVIYQFVCLSAWYSCKAAPLQRSTTQRLWLTQIAAAAIISIIWVACAKLLVLALASFPTFQGLDERFSSQIPIIFGAGLLLYLLSVASHYVILALEESSKAEARALETSILARDAELKALKAQVNPHFLFNSLNSISALTSVDPEKAREMCILLADFLRMTLGLGEKVSVPLSEELSLVDRYLAIEKVRFGERLQVAEHIDEATKAVQLPPLILQPLVENAVTHGIANLSAGGFIRVSSTGENGRVVVTVENSFDPEATPARKSGLGLKNVRQRLEALYGDSANLHISAENEMFRVELSLPGNAAEVSR